MRNSRLEEVSRPVFEAQMRAGGLESVWLARTGNGRYQFNEVQTKWQLWCAAMAYADENRPEVTAR